MNDHGIALDMYAVDPEYAWVLSWVDNEGEVHTTPEFHWVRYG